MYYEVLIGKGVGKGMNVLTYTSSLPLSAGVMVEVPLMRGKAPGVVVKKVARPNFKCREINRILYSNPLPKHLVKIATWMSEYYATPVSGVMGMILPNGVLKKRRSPGVNTKTEQNRTLPNFSGTLPIPLNPAQKNALQALQEAPGGTKLLLGVTGSGKTNIYLTEAFKALSGQKSVVLLVPEIALTGQLVKVFHEVFPGIITVIHSKQTEVERQKIFDSLLLSDTPQIVIGPRSALFAPLSNLGLIIIDEEHEPTYYQENTPKYSAVRVASKMAEICKCPCILGSATPTIEDFYIAKKRGSLVVLSEKAKKTAIKPKTQIIDFKDRGSFSKNRYFSNALIQAIQKNLESGKQSLIFHNRRGSSPLTICENCGEELMCPNCFLPLTLHVDTYEMRCHTCGYHARVPSNCPHCGGAGLIHKGFGTKLLESELVKLFPNAVVKRFDADNRKGETLEAMYADVLKGRVNILVGTQILAKGLDLPLLSTVGIVQADAGLTLPDFASEERVFQLLTQVMGRVGRGHSSTAEVIIQTFQPEHPVLSFAIDENYLGFAEYLLKQRARSGFPPFKFVAKLAVTMKTEVSALKKARTAYSLLAKDTRFLVSPPCPAFHERNSRGFTWEITVRCSSRNLMIAAFHELDKNFHVSLDPPSLL